MEQYAISLNQLLGWSIGTSVIVACFISALWSIYFNRIKEGQKAEFQKQIENQKSEFTKELETLKAKNDKCNYITKTQFDAEFKMYQELSKKMFDAYIKTCLSKEHIETIYTFSECLNNYFPFINEEICKEYVSFKEMILGFANKLNKNLEFNVEFESKNIAEKINIINEKLSAYLKTLKVYED